MKWNRTLQLIFGLIMLTTGTLRLISSHPRKWVGLILIGLGALNLIAWALHRRPPGPAPDRRLD